MSDYEICEKILLDVNNKKYKEILNGLQASIIEANSCMTQPDAIKYILNYVMYTPFNMDKEMGLKKKHEFTLDILNNDLFPHCQEKIQKIYFLGYMANKLLQVSFGWMSIDDRDSYLNKRIDLTGTLLNNLFRNYFNKLVKDMEKQIIKEINTGSWKSTVDYLNIVNMTNIYKIIKSTTIENGLKRALSTGDFGIKHINSNKVGVAQVLNRLTYVSSLSHARRISTPIDKSGKLIPPRKLHSTSWGFLCLAGDVDVLLSNRMDTKKIKNIKDGDLVNTINRETLLDEPSDMYAFFSKMPDKLYEITTISGRKIKATAEHPFLTKTLDGKYEMKNVIDLRDNDKVIIRHTVKPIIDENNTFVKINDSDVLEYYRMELLELNLLNINIPIRKLKIISRIIGALNTDGHIDSKECIENPDKIYYSSSFNVGEEYDAFQLADDIKKLGFGSPLIRRRTTKFEDKVSSRTTTYNTWEVAKGGSFAYFIYLLGGFVGKKIDMKRIIPEWLVNAELSVKREFLSAFQGGDGSRLSYQKNCGNKYGLTPYLGITYQTTHNDYLNDTTEYIRQIINMFTEFCISCRIKIVKVCDEKSKVGIVFSKSTESLLKYADTINYTYCEEKRRVSAPIIEHLKIREYHKDCRDNNYQYIMDNYTNKTIDELINYTQFNKKQIQNIISKYKKGQEQCTLHFTTDLIYETYIKENIVDNGCVCVSILCINEVEPELVYDFTTRSENHSFVASSFIVSNCPVECFDPMTPIMMWDGTIKNAGDIVVDDILIDDLGNPTKVRTTCSGFK